MRLKDNTNPFIHVNPPYQLMVIHSSKLVYNVALSHATKKLVRLIYALQKSGKAYLVAA